MFTVAITIQIRYSDILAYINFSGATFIGIIWINTVIIANCDVPTFFLYFELQLLGSQARRNTLCATENPIVGVK